MFEFSDQFAKKYIANPVGQQLAPTQNVSIVNYERENLTVDDQSLDLRGLPLELYDAFVLFAEEDIGFAREIIDGFKIRGLKVLYALNRDFSRIFIFLVIFLRRSALKWTYLLVQWNWMP